MSKFDFDKIIERKNTDSFKWDMNLEYFGKEDVIPMWVADMDFACAKPITDAIKKRADHPIYGYPVRRGHFIDAVANWFHKRYNFTVKKEWLAFAPPGVIYAVYTMLNILTEKGDKVIINMPNYDPLFDCVTKSGRTLVECPLQKDGDTFFIDLALFEEMVTKEKPKLLIMSNPHNPTGRVFTQSELKGVADICLKNDVFMIIDEIHADFVAKSKGHIAFASLGEDIANQSMVCYSANKGFNLGGLQMCTLILANKDKRDLFNEQMLIAQTRLDTTFGAVATETAYTDPLCEEWLDAAIEYVDENKKIVADFLAENCPKVKMMQSEGTFLVWLDFSQINIYGRELEQFLIDKASVALCAGYEFGEAGKSYMRMNVACSKFTVLDALNKITNAVNSL